MVILGASVLVIGLCLWISNNAIIWSKYDLRDNDNEYDNLHTINLVHVSDLHNKAFGNKQQVLMHKIKNSHPDAIMITGDIVDNKNYKNAEIFIKHACDICPVFYITGNHEYMAGNFTDLKKALDKYKVHILLNSSEDFFCKGRKLTIYGLDDPWVSELNKYDDYISQILGKFDFDNGNYNVLLSHRLELLDIYSNYNINLVLCGHAHGGQFRLPFIGGFIAPNQGLFPKYYQGKHIKNQTIEIISRGLGNSVIPFRLFNQPELILIKI